MQFIQVYEYEISIDLHDLLRQLNLNVKRK